MSTSARRRNSGSASTKITSMTAAAARRRSSSGSEDNNNNNNNNNAAVVVPRVTSPGVTASVGRRRVSGGSSSMDTSRVLGVLREDEEITTSTSTSTSTITTRSRAAAGAVFGAGSPLSSSSSYAHDAMTPPRDGFTLLADRKRDEQRRKLEEDLKAFSMSSSHKCPKCSKTVYAKEANSFDGVLYHKLCSTCDGKGGKCRASLVPAVATCHQGKIYCQFCLQREEGIVGFGPAFHATRKSSFSY